MKKSKQIQILIGVSVLSFLLLISTLGYGQASAAVDRAITTTNGVLRQIVDGALKMLMLVGAILAVIGALTTFREIQAQKNGQSSGHEGISNWLIGGVFLILVPYIISQFFLSGVQL
jgi:TRAP-type C4-dicarboxylate transport system permease small subunit